MYFRLKKIKIGNKILIIRTRLDGLDVADCVTIQIQTMKGNKVRKSKEINIMFQLLNL